jgi:hypothetical protein
MKPLFLLCLLIFCASASADEGGEKFDASASVTSWAFDGRLLGISSDFGAEFGLVTPTLGRSDYSFALSYANLTPDWGISGHDFQLVSLSLLHHNILGERTRAYQKMGFSLLLPESTFSSQPGFAFLPEVGLEFFPGAARMTGLIAGISFFGEFGIALPVINARANQIPGSPYYAAGVVTSVGGRYYF